MAKRTGLVGRIQHFIEVSERSLVKAVTYRILIILLDYFLILTLTQSSDVAVKATLGISIYTTVAYFAHERLWNRIKWGRKTKRNH